MDVNVVRNDVKLLDNYTKVGAAAMKLDSAAAMAQTLKGPEKEAAEKKVEKAKARYTLRAE